jgi:two-component system, sensor histidine kinase PdtaS
MNITYLPFLIIKSLLILRGGKKQNFASPTSDLRLFPKVPNLVCVLVFLLLQNSLLLAQDVSFLPDSIKTKLKDLPESQQDSFLSLTGDNYFSQLTVEGYNKALECYKKELEIAEKHRDNRQQAVAYVEIASVYDALGTDRQQALAFFKKAYDLKVQYTIKNMSYVEYLLAHAYQRVGDSLNSMIFLKLSFDYYVSLKQKNKLPKEYWDEVILQTAYLSLQNKAMPQFIYYFGQVDKTVKYTNTQYPLGRYFAICNARYAYEKGDYQTAIESFKTELGNATTDSSLMLGYLAQAYSKAGNYAAAYEVACQLNTFDALHVKSEAEKDIRVNMLKMDKALEEKAKEALATQKRYLLWGLLGVGLATLVAGYFWWENRKDKIQLAKSNREKELLLNEIHHRVKNNLQLLYSLAQLQLPSIKDDNAKVLWQKNLSQLKTMVLVNDKLRYTEGGNSIVLTDYVNDLTTYFSRLFSTKQKPFVIDAQLPIDWIATAEFAIPFGLILSELLVNSYKYDDKTAEKTNVIIKIDNTTTHKLTCFYTDFGKMQDPSVIETKEVGGIALIRDLTEQLKGKLTISHEPDLSFSFNFPK